jgi:hypothetical protein
MGLGLPLRGLNDTVMQPFRDSPVGSPTGASEPRTSRRSIGLRRDVPGLLADCAVDGLAEEVGVAGVACCLLDEVQEHPAQ